MNGPGPLRILLVGFMGSGKSAVGADLAMRLGWRFADADEVVEQERGVLIEHIFSTLGEARFREIEHEVMQALLKEDQVVVASGGGWAALPGRLSDLGAGTTTVWLRVGAEEAVRRAANQSHQRPLLSGPNPLGAARELLLLRTPHYAQSQHEVDTEGLSVEDVSIRVMELVGLDGPKGRH